MQKDYQITQEQITAYKSRYRNIRNDLIVMIDHYVNNFSEYLAQKENIHRNDDNTKIIIEYPEPIRIENWIITKIVVTNAPEGKLGLCEMSYLEKLIKDSSHEKVCFDTISIPILIELLDILRLHVVNKDIYVKNYTESLQKKDKKNDLGTTELKTLIGEL